MRNALVVVLVALLATPAAHAQMSNAETIAGLGGRVLGAAKACGVDGNSLARTGERVLAVAKGRAKSERELNNALTLFPETYNAGIGEVQSGRTKCTEARRAYRDLQQKVGG